jgi:hypothetical protein
MVGKIRNYASTLRVSDGLYKSVVARRHGDDVFLSIYVPNSEGRGGKYSATVREWAVKYIRQGDFGYVRNESPDDKYTTVFDSRMSVEDNINRLAADAYYPSTYAISAKRQAATWTVSNSDQIKSISTNIDKTKTTFYAAVVAGAVIVASAWYEHFAGKISTEIASGITALFGSVLLPYSIALRRTLPERYSELRKAIADFCDAYGRDVKS